MSGQVSPGSAGEYQADEQAGVARNFKARIEVIVNPSTAEGMWRQPGTEPLFPKGTCEIQGECRKISDQTGG